MEPYIPLLLYVALFGLCPGSTLAYDCTQLKDSGAQWDLGALRGAHSVSSIIKTPPTVTNLTWTIDLCEPLKLDKSQPKEDQCPEKTQICGIESITHDNETLIHKVIPVAGDFDKDRALSPTILRLKKSPAKSDAGKEGLRLTLQGGQYPEGPEGVKQKAVLDLLCDPKASTKAVVNTEKSEETAEALSPTIKNYDEREGLLTIEWKTKHACESSSRVPGGDGWGFFTWFIIILFLGTAAYLIFGSWVNYNRYGARGWDLLPHGDAIREFPYIISDWGRRMFSTLQGGGMRGGYSAV